MKDVGHRVPGRLLTIAATYGAGGSVVGPRLAHELGIPFADRLTSRQQLPRLAGEHASDEELADTPGNPFLKALALISADWNIPAPADASELPDRIRARVLAGLEELAAQGGAVVLGRAAVAALGKRRGAFHVRLDGPVERRTARGAAWEGVGLDNARARLEETDASRERYVRQLYRVDPTDTSLYHLVVDATVLSIDACVDLLASAARAAWAFEDSHETNLGPTADLPPT
jgi:cytidylate kinase